MIVIQEADEIAYRCAFACQRQAYLVHTNKGTYDLKDKYTKTDIKNHYLMKGKVLDEDYTLEGYRLIDQEEDVINTLDKYLERLWNIEHKSINKITGVELWLSPSNRSNFRHGVANIVGAKGVGYKAGRGEKPHWLGFIRDRLLNTYEAQEINGFEADDALGIRADENTILSHIDKDIDMVGNVWHYNHVLEKLYFVDGGLGSIDYDEKKKKVLGNGLLFFYVQLLTGDDTDNIPGCLNPEKEHHKKQPRISAAEAFNILQNVQSEKVAFNKVKQMFEYTYNEQWQEAIEECADLLWICRDYNETGRQYLKNKGFI